MTTILVTIILANSTVFADDRQINLNDYPRDTRERYVASLALERNISYEEADRIEREESNLLLGRDEVLKYKTIDKRAGRIDDGNNYSQSVYIATEVRYVWGNANNRLVNIESAGSPYLYIPGVSNLDITGGA